MSEEIFTTPISRHIWDTKYRLRDAAGPLERTVQDTWRRIARALAVVERDPGWEERFYAALAGFRFLPGGRIQAGAGTDRRPTLFNCFIMGPVAVRLRWRPRRERAETSTSIRCSTA